MSDLGAVMNTIFLVSVMPWLLCICNGLFIIQTVIGIGHSFQFLLFNTFLFRIHFHSTPEIRLSTIYKCHCSASAVRPLCCSCSSAWAKCFTRNWQMSAQSFTNRNGIAIRKMPVDSFCSWSCDHNRHFISVYLVWCRWHWKITPAWVFPGWKSKRLQINTFSVFQLASWISTAYMALRKFQWLRSRHMWNRTNPSTWQPLHEDLCITLSTPNTC